MSAVSSSSQRPLTQPPASASAPPADVDNTQTPTSATATPQGTRELDRFQNLSDLDPKDRNTVDSILEKLEKNILSRPYNVQAEIQAPPKEGIRIKILFTAPNAAENVTKFKEGLQKLIDLQLATSTDIKLNNHDYVSFSLDPLFFTLSDDELNKIFNGRPPVTDVITESTTLHNKTTDAGNSRMEELDDNGNLI